MKILVANDDGIQAKGMRELVFALKADGHEVFVSCPHMERSASGHGITIGRPVRVYDTIVEGARQAIIVEGLPADCVKIGLSIYEERGVYCDMVVSGINHGGNIGTDTLYSGTVSAAIEGALCGRRGIAVSIVSPMPKQFKTACDLALHACKLDESLFADKTVLSINVPDLLEHEIKGIKIAPLGLREYDEWFTPQTQEDGGTAFVYGGQPLHKKDFTCDTNDVGAIQENYATITPLHYDLTNYSALNKLKDVWKTIK